MRIGYPPTHSLAPAAKTGTLVAYHQRPHATALPLISAAGSAHASGTTDANRAVRSSPNGPKETFTASVLAAMQLQRTGLSLRLLGLDDANPRSTGQSANSLLSQADPSWRKSVLRTGRVL